MSKFVVITFTNEQKAYEAVSALDTLDAEGSITLYGTMVVEREANGSLSTKRRTPAELIGTGLGGLFGALVGALAGPVGAAVGLATGTVAGGFGGIIHGDVSDEFIEDIAKDMAPGTFAVLAEVSEPWNAPIDTRMKALGGTVRREERGDVVDDILEKRATARRSRLDAWKAKRRSKKAEHSETSIELEIMDAQDKLQRTADKARYRLASVKQELDTKLEKLEAQAAKATPDVKQQIDTRIAELRADFAAREQKLDHALDLAQLAL